jgi:hypothetical protein
MDEQTMKDYIEDLLQERAGLYEKLQRLEQNRDQWQELTLKWQAHSTELMTQLDTIRALIANLAGANG